MDRQLLEHLPRPKMEPLARISHTFSSRSRRKGRRECVAPRVTRKRVPQAPANVLYGTLRRPTEGATRFAGRTVRPDHCADAVEGV